MRSDLKNFVSSSRGHTELRTHSNRSLMIQLVNGNLMENFRREVSGSSARAYRNGRWGFASVPDESPAALADILAKAERNANLLTAKKAPALTSTAGSKEIDFSTKKARLSQKDLVEFLRALDNYLVSKYPRLTGRKIHISGLDIEKSVATSAGSTVYTNVPRAHIHISLNMEKDGKPVEVMTVLGSRGHFEDIFTTPEALFGKLDALYVDCEKKVNGFYANAGTHDVILAPDLAGILAHEAIGHTTEADSVLGGSIAGDNMGRVVASDLVTMVDFAHTALGSVCPSPVYVDDEGTPAEDCVIIENGVLKTFMHNLESSAKLGMKAQGNARGFLFSDEPLIRMRNTAILPGKSKLADMIASIDDGFLLSSPGNGQADSSGEFMFLVKCGYEIKGGKLGRALHDTTISGKAFDMMKTVSMISDDMVWKNNGFCGKKQPMAVGMGGPAIKCRMNLGGR